MAERLRRLEPPSAWMTMDEVARRLGISLRETYRRARAGEIPPCRLEGSRWRVLRPELEAWLDGTRRPADGPGISGISRDDLVEAIREALDGLAVTIAITRQERTRA